jgi:hypothetical protein
MSNSRKKTGVVIPVAVWMAAMTNHAIGVEITPNPNPAGNTITIDTADVESHGEPYETSGTINILSGGVLTNFREFTILSGTVSIELGGKLINDAEEGVFVVDEVGSFYNFGIIDNYGRLKNSWAFGNRLGSVFNNYAGAALTNTRGMDQRGTLINAGVFLNSVDVFSGDGAGLQNVGDWINTAGSLFTNLGVADNFGTITNSGFIQNRLGASGGITQGKFENRNTVDNLAGGEISNEHRWFNRSGSIINNSGTFTNSIRGLGLSNESGSTINNLAGGTFHADQVVNSSGQINNAGTFHISAMGAIGDTGGGTYTQTNGSTTVNGQLDASIIDIQAGLLAGTGMLDGTVTIGLDASIGPGNPVGPGNSVGTMTILVDLDLSGTLAIELAGPETFDVLDVGGIANLGGDLNVSILDGYTSMAGDTMGILTAVGGISGTFDTVNLPTRFGGLEWFVNYNPTNVTLVTTYAADFDEDGDVDENDLVLWEGGFGSTMAVHNDGDADGDLDADGTDFLNWQQQFGSGLEPPVVVSNVAIPEPMSVILFMLGCAAIGLLSQPGRTGRSPWRVVSESKGPSSCARINREM